MKIRSLDQINKDINEGVAFPSVGLKNHIINGGFDVWQRSIEATGGGYISADRWRSANTTTTLTKSEIVPTGEGFSSSLRMSATSNNTSIQQGIELKSNGVAGVFQQGRTFTLSFWVMSDVTNNINFIARFQDVVGNATNQVEVIADTVIATANTTWQKVSYTFTIGVTPAVTNKALTILLYPSTDSINYTYVTGVQLEEGSVATPFEQRPIGLEEMLCRNYYRELPIRAIGQVTSTTQASLVFNYEPMRATPTISAGNPSGCSLSGAGGTNYTVTTINTAINQNGVCQFTVAIGTANLVAGDATKFASLTEVIRLDAEL